MNNVARFAERPFYACRTGTLCLYTMQKGETRRADCLQNRDNVTCGRVRFPESESSRTVEEVSLRG